MIYFSKAQVLERHVPQTLHGAGDVDRSRAHLLE
jgi:hypothetical protein